MAHTQKLYQILEKANIETKIAVEIQDWIVDTLEEQRERSMVQFVDTKLLPMHLEMRSRFEAMDTKFEAVNSRFDSLEKRIDATNFSIRILGVPIVGATIGGLGIIFLQIYERLM
jgi:hypothetical protein